MQKLENIFYY